MRGPDREPEQTKHRDPLRRFSSQEELLAAVAHLQEYLRILENWKTAADKLKVDQPSVN